MNKIYCSDPELRELLIEANKNNKNFEFNDIEVPDQNNFNHVDYILECASFLPDSYKDIFCFRFYRIDSKEVKLEDIPELTDFRETIVYVVNQPNKICVCTKSLNCMIVNNRKKQMQWDGYDVDYSEPAIENYVYENYLFNECTYIIPTQLIPNMV